ncbi:MAG: 50S ribosomal protein L25 [Planctomycetota bacterium]|jgi:large subunit ribosomal protein L25
MQDTPTLQAQRRDRTGTRYAQRLRQAGRLPAVIYGHKTDPVAVSVDAKELLGLLTHGAHVINVDVDDAASEMCLVKDIQFGYLGDDVIHADFTRVNLDEEVHVHVHLHFVGEPASAQRAGAILRHDQTELEVVCKVSDIPEEIKVDQSGMDLTLTVGEIELPPGLRAAASPETLVASVTFVHAVEEPTGEEVEVAADAAEPEVISESKTEEPAEDKETS